MSAISILEVTFPKNSATLVAASRSKLLLLNLIEVGLCPAHSFKSSYNKAIEK
jgi:hypothetical protein